MDLSVDDLTQDLAMISLQGPQSERILEKIISEHGSGKLPIKRKNRISEVQLKDGENTYKAFVSRTGYTGEPVGFEVFVPAKIAGQFWNSSVNGGAMPIGLGARDTLRMEAGYPLYGHELGLDLEGRVIPIFALQLAMKAVKVDAAKGDFYGRDALLAQYNEMRQFLENQGKSKIPLDQRLVPGIMLPIVVLNEAGDSLGANPLRRGDDVYLNGEKIGVVTSGTSAPYARIESEGLVRQVTGEDFKRGLGIAYVSGIVPNELGTRIQIKTNSLERPASYRGRSLPGMIVAENLRAVNPLSHAIVHPNGYKR